MKKILLILMMILMTGCRTTTLSEAVDENSTNDVVSTGEGNQKVEIIVSAAASLTEAMEEVEIAYEEVNPKVDVIINLGSSGSLQRQIEQGAPTDVFISASLDKMNTLMEERYLLKDSYRALLKNSMVLIVPKDESQVKSFDDLDSEKVELIAIGEPESVPAGMYAKEVLNYLGLYDKITDKIIVGKNVKEVLTWVEMNEVDAGMVYQTDAIISEKVIVVSKAPADAHEEIIYPVAVINESEHIEEAEAFVEYLMASGMPIFESYGFTDGR